MSPSQLLGSSFVDGLRAPHYVNGRLLTAEDLVDEQRAVLDRLAWVGQAAGHGVVDGLLVRAATGSNTSLTLTPGLGVTRSGAPIRLATATTLPLVLTASTPAPADDAGRFRTCDLSGGGSGGTSVPGGAYVVTAAPASRFEGEAPLRAAPGSILPPGCAARWEVEGVQVKAIRLDGFNPSGSGVTDLNRRNLLAHWCFGSLALRDLARDPFSFDDAFGGLDGLGTADLTPCDLPLAVFHWTGSALTFVDPWPARRRLVRPHALESWSGLLSDRRVADAQARFLQFQEQVDALARSGSPSTTSGPERFRFLPPVGFLPIAPASLVDRLVRSDADAVTKTYTGLDRLKLNQALLQARRETTEVRAQKTVSQAQAVATFNAGTTISGQAAASQRFGFLNADVTEDPRLSGLRVAAETLGEEIEAVQAQLKTLQELERRVAELEERVGGGGSRPAQPKDTSGLQAAERLAEAIAASLKIGADDARGFDLERFFDTRLGRIGIVDRDTVDFVLQRSWHDEAIDLSQGESTLVDVYLVEENLLSGAQPYALFAKRIRPIAWAPLRNVD